LIGGEPLGIRLAVLPLVIRRGKLRLFLYLGLFPENINLRLRKGDSILMRGSVRCAGDARLS
jgi:hypothetical protein